ncbi:MAG: hypothetical protein JRI70_04665 [Deltaproteobacteria bacterium]|nr:hypothetical protein [Deltaproteobacteria bacterium]
MADELEALAPFGVGNPEPVLMISDIDLLTARRVGTHHLQMRFRPSAARNVKGNKSIDAIFFNQTSEVPQPGNLYRIACHVRWNRWREQKRMQLVIKAIDAVR